MGDGGGGGGGGAAARGGNGGGVAGLYTCSTGGLTGLGSLKLPILLKNFTICTVS